MKATFFKSSESHHDLGIHLEPETMEEELLLDMFTKFSATTEFDFRFHGWEQGGGQRYPDGQPQFTRGVRGSITRKVKIEDK